MKMLGLMRPQRPFRWTSPILPAKGRRLDTLPERSVARDSDMGSRPHAEASIGHPAAPANVLGGDLPKPTPMLLGLLDHRNRALMLCVLHCSATRRSDPMPDTLLPDNHRPSRTFRAKKFPSTGSFSMAFSSSIYVRNILSFGDELTR